MKTRVLLFILIVFTSLNVFSKNVNSTLSDRGRFGSDQRIINANDSIIFDLASATITATYIDLPIYLISDDVILAVDYAIKFNLSKLTFSATIDLVIPDPSFTSLSYFNPNDLFLRYTGGSAVQNLPASGGVHTTKIRFNLSAPCVSITAADFIQVKAYLNGTQCSHGITNLNFGKFIPSANFSSGPACTNTNVLFTDISTVGSGTISSWSWNFDNGSSSILQNPSISYTTAGTAAATLIVTASSGCKDTIANALNINLPPVSGFSYSLDCVKDSVLFKNSSTVPAGTIIGSFWNFGDANGTSSLTSPAYNYSASGIYTVTLISTSYFSCSSIASVTVSLLNKVSANFTSSSNNACLGSRINFNDASTYSLSTINNWAWNFGDGGSSSQQNPGYTYTGPGTYSVTLTSTSIDGCKGFITKTVVVNALPIVQFGVNSFTSCAGATASFTSLSTNTNVLSYFWNFGNGVTSNSQNAVYSYSINGTYQVKLVVTTSVGCSDSLTKPFNASFPELPPAVFTETVVSNGEVAFSNLTPNSKRVNWNFGDNRTSIVNNPFHTFPGIETYKVCLTSYDSLNCISSACKNIYVGFSRKVAVPSSFTPNKDNTNDVLKVKGGPLSEMQFQIFNEWGNLLFSSPSQDIGWDGTFKGEPQPVGVYEYILNGKTMDNQIINLYGVVNLTR